MIKAIERLGRRIIVGCVSLLFGVRRRDVELPGDPKILVVRFDDRLGNLLMLTPMLDALRTRFPQGRIELLANPRAEQILGPHRSLDEVLTYRKRAVFGTGGPLRTPFALRRRRYDLAIEASNPTDPSVTQTLITRLSGARHTIGADHPSFGRLFSARVALNGAGPHEIDIRMRLLAPIVGDTTAPPMSLPDWPDPAGMNPTEPFTILNVGARLKEKQLGPEAYAAVGERIAGPIVITYGPAERALAQQTADRLPAATLAPETDVPALAALMRRARAVISCDTGPMHLAVATGTPTCGLFVSTPPDRYGYSTPPHAAIDALEGITPQALSQLEVWLGALPAESH